MKIILIFSLILMLAVISSCDTKSGNSGPKYTIKALGMSNGVDNDSDGYYSSVRLYFDIDVDEDGDKSVFVKIYYRLNGDSEYMLYFTSVSFTINGTTSDDEQFIVLDSFSHGGYDFKVEVLEENGTSVKSQNETFDLTLESTNEDQLPINIWSINWSNSVDADGDGYFSSRRMNIDADIPNGSASIYAKIYYKISTNSSYSLYRTTSSWTINGSTSSDSHFETIGNSPTLSHNTYDFKVELFRTGTSTPIVASDDPSSDADLNNENFETTAQEPVISIYGSYWTNIVDNDADGRRQWGMLNVDVDVSTGSKSIRVLLLIREEGTTSWFTWRNSEYFTISGGSGSDFISFSVGNLATLNYEFRVDVYEEGNGTVQDSHLPTDDSDLDNEAFELLGSDSWYVSTYDTKWTLEVDGDSDGFRSSGRITFDIANGLGSNLTIRARILYKSVTNGSTSYSVYYTTGDFTLTSSGWDDFWIAVGSTNSGAPALPQDTYNFEIQILYNSGASIISSNRRDTPIVEEGMELLSTD